MSNTPNLPVFLYDSIDKENAHNNSAPKINSKIDYRVILASIFGGIVFFIILIVFHMIAWNMLIDYEYHILGGILLAILYSFVTLVLLGMAILFLSYFWTKIQRNKLINIMEHQMTYDQLPHAAFLSDYFNVAQTRAAHSTFAGVQNLTYSPSKHIESQEQVETIHDTEDIENVQEEYPSTLREMEKAGLINRSGNSILVGFMEEDLSE